MPTARLALAVLALWFLHPATEADAAPPRASSVSRAFVFSPYKDVLLYLDPHAPTISIVTDDGVVPAVREGRSNLPRGVSTLTWAFATGECGAELWRDVPAQAIADANVRAFDRAGIDYIISTGGAEGVFTCASDEGMERFIARYQSPHLVGIDFDIERDQSAALIDSLVRRVQTARKRYPRLRFTFTLATFGAGDGSHRSLNATGEKVMHAIRAAHLKHYYINLMVMNYGEASARNCVLSAGGCDMQRSAVQAAVNVHRKYGVPLHRIELTAMIGVNDVVANVFTPADARALIRMAQRQHLGGVHYWSLDRDMPCPGANDVTSTCHSLPGVPSRSFISAFVAGLH